MTARRKYKSPILENMELVRKQVEQDLTLSGDGKNKSNRKFILLEEKEKRKFQEQVNKVLANYVLTSHSITFRDDRYIAFMFVKADNEL